MVVTGPATVVPSVFLMVTVAPLTSDANTEPLNVTVVGTAGVLGAVLVLSALLQAARTPIELIRSE